MMANKTPFFTLNRSFRWLLYCFIILAVFSITAIVSAPYLAKRYSTGWILKNGADFASIEKITLNPFNGRLSLQGLDIKKDDKTVLSDSTISIDIGLRSLFSKKARIEKALFEDIVIDIERFEDNSIRIGSYRYTPGESGDSAPEKKDSELGWIFITDKVDFQNVIVRYRQPDLDTELIIEQASIENFNTIEGDKSGTLNLSGSLNGAPLTAELATFNILPTLVIKGTLQFSEFRLENIATLLEPYLNTFNGTGEADGTFSVTLLKDQPLAVSYNGTIGVKDTVIGGDGWATSGAVGWNGEVIYSSPQADQGMDIAIDGLLSGKQLSFGMEKQNLQVDEPELSISGKTTIQIADSVNISSNATLSRENSKFTLDTISLSTGVSSYTGTISYNSGSNDQPMSVVSDGQFMFENTNFNQSDLLKISQEELSTAGKTELSLANTLNVTYQGDITLNGSELRTDQMTFSTDQLSWKGDTTFKSTTEQPSSLLLIGNLNSRTLQLELAESNIQVQEEDLTISTDSGITLDSTIGYTGNSSLKAGKLTISEKDVPILTIDELLTTSLSGINQQGITLESFTAGTIKLPPSEIQPYEITLDSIVLSGVESQDLHTFTAEQLEVTSPRVNDPDSATNLADISSAVIKTITVNKDLNVSVENMLINESTFLSNNKEESGQPSITLGSAAVSPINWSPDQGTTIDTLAITDLYATFAKEKVDPAAATEQEPPDNAPPADDQAKGIPVNIKAIQITGNSGLTFKDNSLTQPFSAELLVESIDIKNVDLTNPENSLSYILKGSVDKYAKLDISGSVAPLATPFTFEKKTTLRNYPIHDLSPYVVETIGSAFKDGQLDISSDVTITGQKIHSENKLKLKEIEVVAIDKELAAELDNQLPVPLDTALGILKDNQNDVHLSVSISGELSDLDVGVSGIIITALSKAITAGLAPYLAYTMLGPTGAIAYLGVSLGQSLLKTNFPIIEFEASVSALTDDQKAILDKVGEKIASKYEKDTEVNYSICPKVLQNEIDPAAQSGSEEEKGKALYKLGDSRAAAVKSYLVDNFNIDGERLLSCNPGVDFNKDGKGVVEFRE